MYYYYYYNIKMYQLLINVFLILVDEVVAKTK